MMLATFIQAIEVIGFLAIVGGVWAETAKDRKNLMK